jgi:hypothetical protein
MSFDSTAQLRLFDALFGLGQAYRIPHAREATRRFVTYLRPRSGEGDGLPEC